MVRTDRIQSSCQSRVYEPCETSRIESVDHHYLVSKGDVDTAINLSVIFINSVQGKYT